MTPLDLDGATCIEEPIPLPPGWVAKIAPSGRTFFINFKINKSTYRDPRTGELTPLPTDSDNENQTISLSSQISDHSHSSLSLLSLVSLRADYQLIMAHSSECLAPAPVLRTALHTPPATPG